MPAMALFALERPHFHIMPQYLGFVIKSFDPVIRFAILAKVEKDHGSSPMIQRSTVARTTNAYYSSPNLDEDIEA